MSLSLKNVALCTRRRRTRRRTRRLRRIKQCGGDRIGPAKGGGGVGHYIIYDKAVIDL